MESIKILLQCPCEFTRIGMLSLLNAHDSESKDNMIVSVSNLEQAEDVLVMNTKLDIIILTLNSLYYNAVELLDVLSRRIPIHHPDSKIIILTDDKCIEALKRHLKGIENFGTILEANVPIETIQSELSKINSPDQSFNSSAIKANCVLSSRELTILKKLLHGKSISQVAKELTLNYKTISHYKRSAMSKLGIRTLHPLFIPF
ncbi:MULTISPECIES: LuxR C-terminal-related transcriptional regulator [unclassified Serratia (in: enterobacteria)]|uniref:LuxR C-terminal-related transcriptional regulator n=1 Tax=unclassified Serratia (in: enterobacteria) TaxID=2647522 RepID=UPI00307648D2